MLRCTLRASSIDFCFHPSYTWPPPMGGGRRCVMCGNHKSTVVHRLSSIAGHAKSVERMIREDAYCTDIIKQTHAIQAALARLAS